MTNFGVDTIGFVDPHKAIARSTFSTFPSAWNGGELEGGVESGRLKCHFISGRGFGFTRDL